MTTVLGHSVLFSGCAVDRAGASARQATIALARVLGMELWEGPAGGCCGARTDRPASQTALRDLLAPLGEARSQELTITCLSPGCRQVLARHLCPEDRREPAAERGPLHAPWLLDGVQLLAQGVDPGRLAGALATSLSPLRVALHGTCHGDHIPASDPAPPSSHRSGTPGEPDMAGGRTDHDAPATEDRTLADLVAMTGAEPAEEISVAGRCAETPLLPRVAGRQASAPACLGLAARAGVDGVVTPCFLCHGGLNERQRWLDREDPARSLPVPHLAQLFGLACGVAPLHLELGRLTVSARRVLAPFVG